MNNAPILVIMAAGMGSRYGGLKQMDPIGRHGELILDYSLFDAYRAGFRRVCFIIKEEMEADFRALITPRIGSRMEVMFVHQALCTLPEGFSVPEGRTKPFGTAHAVLCAKNVIDAPFAVINADDYYGVSAFETIYAFLQGAKDSSPEEYAMVGYLLENTVSENGHVSRGVCKVDEKGYLIAVTERTHIIKSSDGPLYTEDENIYLRLQGDSIVSMNMWGFTPAFMAALEAGFPAFLREGFATNALKCEYYLPSVVSNQLKAGAAVVHVLTSPERWYGVTYREDKPTVTAALQDFADKGIYPAPLWGEQI